MTTDHLWKKGQSGNYKGRPKKGQTITDLLMAKLDKEDFTNQIIAGVKRGEYQFIKMAWEYLDGKPNQKLEITQKNDYSELSDEEIKNLIVELAADLKQ